MKTLAVLSSVGVVFGMSQRVLAQAVHVDPMPWSAQLGVCGGCLTILLLTIVRVIPKMAEENRKSVERSAEIHAAAIGDLSEKIDKGNDSTIGLLREVLIQKKNGGQS